LRPATLKRTGTREIDIRAGKIAGPGMDVK
jgi:hypothetical protein